jgi:hypothetical protein
MTCSSARLDGHREAGGQPIGARKFYARSLALVAAVSMLAGCISLPDLKKVDEVHVCAESGCDPAGQGRTAEQLLGAVHQMLKHNEDVDFMVCDSNPTNHNCESVGACHFVVGLLMPGGGCMTGGRFTKVDLDPVNRRVTATAHYDRTFADEPVLCRSGNSTITARSSNEVVIENDSIYCNWAVVGNMTMSFSFAIDYIDLGEGRLGGYWSHAVSGIGWGWGTGYAIMQFSKHMSKGENWLGADAK